MNEIKDIELFENDLENLLILAKSTLTELSEDFKETFETISECFIEFSEMIEVSSTKQDTLNLALAAFSAAMGVVSLAITIATTEFNKFNMSVLSNPIMLAVTALSLLMLGFAGVTLATNNQSDAYISLAESSKKATDEHQKLIEKSNEAAKSVASEMAYYQSLKRELDTLVDANGRVIEGNEQRVNFIVGKLSNATGQEIKLTDGVIENYEGMSISIDKLIEKKKAEAIIEAHNKEYVEALEKRGGALKALTEAQNKLNLEQKNQSRFMEEWNKSNFDYSLSQEQNAKNAEIAWQGYIKSFKKDVKAASNTYEGYNTTIRNIDQATTDVFNNNYKDVEKTIAGTNAKYASGFEEKRKLIEADVKDELTALQSLNLQKKNMTEEQYEHEKKIAEENFLNKQKDLFELNNKVIEGTDEYKKAMQYLSEQGMDAYNENGKLTEAAKNKLSELGITVSEMGEEYSNALYEMTLKGQIVFDENGNLTEVAQKKLIDVFTGIDELNPAYGEALTKMVNDGQQVFDENGNLTAAAQKKLTDSFIAIGELDPFYSEALQLMADEGKMVFDQNGELTTATQKKLVEAFGKLNEDKPQYASILLQMANDGKVVFDENGNLSIPAQKKLINAYAEMNNLTPEYKQKLLNMADEGKNVFENNGDLSADAKKKLYDAKKAVDDNKTAYSNAVGTAANEGKKKISDADTYGAAGSFILGAINGVNANSWSFYNAVGTIAGVAVAVISKAWEINSPSKKTKRLGASFMEGLEMGIDENKNSFYKGISTIGDNAASVLESSFQSINVNALSDQMRMAIDSQQLQMRGVVQSNLSQEVYTSGRLKVEIGELKGVLQGKIENRILMDGRETAVQLTPFISEELAFSAR